MSEHFPTSREFLIDHLLRIAQGVMFIEEDGGGKTWMFGIGEDMLITYQSIVESTQEEEERNAKRDKEAKAGLIYSSLGIEAKDHMGVPKRLAEIRGEILSKDRQAVAEALKYFSSGAHAEDGYALEMLCKLGDMVDRGREAVQEISLLPRVPRSVDNYISEAASCYRYGFDLACISLCRAAIEEALKYRLKEKFGREAIVEWNKDQERWEEADLSKLIDRASSDYEILQFQQQAHEIRMAGNKCVHGKLKGEQVRCAASEVLIDSRLIVQDLYST